MGNWSSCFCMKFLTSNDFGGRLSAKSESLTVGYSRTRTQIFKITAYCRKRIGGKSLGGPQVYKYPLVYKSSLATKTGFLSPYCSRINPLYRNSPFPSLRMNQYFETIVSCSVRLLTKVGLSTFWSYESSGITEGRSWVTTFYMFCRSPFSSSHQNSKQTRKAKRLISLPSWKSKSFFWVEAGRKQDFYSPRLRLPMWLKISHPLPFLSKHCSTRE